jgi:hypothetical protein
MSVDSADESRQIVTDGEQFADRGERALNCG